MKNLMTFIAVGAVATVSVLALAHLRSDDVETVKKIQRNELTLVCKNKGTVAAVFLNIYNLRAVDYFVASADITNQR